MIYDINVTKINHTEVTRIATPQKHIEDAQTAEAQTMPGDNVEAKTNKIKS